MDVKKLEVPYYENAEAPGWYLGLIHFRRQPFVGNAFILFSSSQLKEILDINDVKCTSMLCISTLASTLLVCRFEKNGN